MKRILITNDDGFQAAGIKVLFETLSEFGEVISLSPAREKSACGHGLNITQPMRISEVAKNYYKLDDGTPADCIYIALDAFFKDRLPDLIVSGINMGSNMGEDIAYSGTVAGAMEGAISGVPSVAFSQILKNRDRQNADFELARRALRDIAGKILEGDFPLSGRRFLNVNIPSVGLENFKGYKVTQQGYRVYRNRVSRGVDPRGFEYFWIGQQADGFKNRSQIEGALVDYRTNLESVECDFEVVKDGYISLTPLDINYTSYEHLAALEAWNLPR